MSEHLSLKEVKTNALKLMEESKYDMALHNWNYIKKNTEEIDPLVLLQIGKGHEQLDSTEEASKAYKHSIKLQADNKSKMDKKLFLESLFALGQIEMRREEYKSAHDAYESFIAYISKESLSIQDETIEFIKGSMKEGQKMIDERLRNANSDGLKNIPYATSGTNSK